MLAETTSGGARTGPATRQLPAGALVAAGALSTQLGAAMATGLFARVGPAGTVTLRLVFAAATLVALTRPRPGALRAHPPRDLAVAAVLGLVLAGMNLCFYEAIDRVPLGVAVTLEFAGPLALSVVSSRRRAHVAWALLAGAGVVLLAGGSVLGPAGRLDPAGVGFALGAGALWAGYILANRATGRRFPGATGLALAMAVAAVVALPLGIAAAGTRLLAPGVLGTGLAVAVLSSAFPYSCEMAALRRVSARAFGVLLSMGPALAALVGLAVLGQRLTLVEVGALLLVVAANAGSSWGPRRRGGSPPARLPRGSRAAVRAHATSECAVTV